MKTKLSKSKICIFFTIIMINLSVVPIYAIGPSIIDPIKELLGWSHLHAIETQCELIEPAYDMELNRMREIVRRGKQTECREMSALTNIQCVPTNCIITYTFIR
ncbi:MAG: hypothetical protein KBA26_00225 [Candidatus Delongbacteria bacterium]|nr:hypothetical protein [Candidatus Delongbacteria bacterium]